MTVREKARKEIDNVILNAITDARVKFGENTPFTVLSLVMFYPNETLLKQAGMSIVELASRVLNMMEATK